MLGDEHIVSPATHREQRPPFDMREATCRAMSDANDAAVARLEKIVLSQTSPTKLPRWAWDFWRNKLGGYDSTLPTGTRIGKRWCRDQQHRRNADARTEWSHFVGEYGVSSKGPEFVSITWYEIDVDEKDK